MILLTPMDILFSFSYTFIHSTLIVCAGRVSKETVVPCVALKILQYLSSGSMSPLRDILVAIGSVVRMQEGDGIIFLEGADYVLTRSRSKLQSCCTK